MKRFIPLIACLPLLLAGLANSQQVLNLQESPPASGLLSAQVTDSYPGTGVANGKLWIFNAEANDRVSFYLRTTVSSNSNPILRLSNSGGSTVAETTGSGDGFGALENVLLSSPGVYQITVFSNSAASTFSLNALLGRGISLEAEANDSALTANLLATTAQAGGFRAVTAGVLDRNPDWSDLGVMHPGDAVNLSLQAPTGSTLAVAGTQISLYKDDDPTAVATATGASLVHTVAASGRYRARLAVPDLDGLHLTFAGGQSVNLGNPAALQITGSQTIEFWIKPNDFNSRQNPYAKAYAGEGTMTIETNGIVNYYYGTGGGNNNPYQSFPTTTPLRAGRWQHLALVRDFESSPKQLRWYLDGKMVGQADASYFPAVAGTLPVTLATGYAGDFRGSMDEVRIWNVARTASEISDNLDNPLTGSETGLVAYYRFSEGTGTTVADATANAITGTINGTPSWGGSAGANLAHFSTQSHQAGYLLNAIIGDTSAPAVTAVTPVPTAGLPLQGTSFAPGNMVSLRGNNGQSYLYTLTGDTGGSIWGTDIYTDDSTLARAAVHAGVLQPGQTGAVRVTVLPGAPSYSSSTRNGVTSNAYGSYVGSYSIESYTPASPFPLDRLYASIRVSFNEPLIATTLGTGITLVAAGPNGTFGNDDDVPYPVSFASLSADYRATFTLNGGAILAPGLYRLTVPVTVTDRAGNQMATPHVEEFTVFGIAGYANEQGDNNTLAAADPLSLSVAANQPDGGFSDNGRTTSSADYPFDVELADLDGDGKLDAVVTQLGSTDGVRMFRGNGDRTFGAPVSFTGLGDEPHDAELLDWDKDGDLDVAVGVIGSDIVALFRNDSTSGSLAFTRLANVVVGDAPYRMAVGDFNADTWPDLAVSNTGTNATTGYSLSILLNDQAGSFTETKIGLSLSPKIRPYGVGVGDFNKDGKADILAGDMDNDDRVALFLGAGDGTFGAPTFLDTPSQPNITDFAVADFNQDGNPDFAAVATDNNAYDFWVFPGNGDGTFGTRVDIDLSDGYYTHLVKTADVNADGWPDLLIGANDHVSVLTNRADGTIGFGRLKRAWGDTYGVAAGDLNGDGRPDLVVADHSDHVLRVLDGNASSPLAADDSATGILHGYGRGFLANSSDADVWSFSAKRGQLLTVAVDNSAFAGNPGQVYEIFDEAGNRFTYFYNDNSWQGQSPPVTIPRDGTYYVRVSWWHDYRGEYRFRVSLAPPGSGQMESEDNNNIAQSDPVSFTLAGNSLSATMAGYLAAYDSSGDYFSLGNLAEGTQVNVTVRLPSTSALTPALTLYKANGTAVTPDTLSPTQLIYTLPAGAEAAYHLRIAGAAGRGVMAEYFMDLALTDTVPPTIVSNSLPAEGSTVTFFSSSFTLGFSEDMLAATVNNLANYQLVGSGGDGTFGDGNEVAYTINSPGYGAGLSASYFLPDGPLQPDTYRFTAKAALKDKLNNNLAADHVRTFTMAGVPGWVLEDRSNNTFPTADTLSLSVAANQPDGGFSDNGRTTSSADYPFDVELADLDGDGKLDAVVTQLGSTDGVRMFRGNGDRTFGAPVSFTGLGDEPHDAELLDWDKDGDLDVAVGVYGSDFVALFRNDSTSGSLAFTRLANVPAGDEPLRLAVADFNGDTWPDLVVANRGTNATTGYSISILLNDQAGSFTETKIGLSLSPKIRPYGVGVGDFNKDGKTDILAGDMDNDDRVALFLGAGDGTFGAPTFLDTPSQPNITDFAVADFNQDGNPDFAAVATDNNAYDFWVFPGNGDGTFGTRVDIDLSDGYYTHLVKTADVNADGWPDLLIGANDHVSVLTNRADGTIGFGRLKRAWGDTYGVAAGDLNGDGRPELVVVDHSDHVLRVLDGNARSPLAADDSATGILHGYGRGFLADSSDADVWSFSAKRGQLLTVAVDNSAFSGNPGQVYEIFDEAGNRFTYFYNDNSWQGQSPPVTIPRDGTYYVRVSWWHDYRGEYRFRVSLAPPGSGQMESEDNNNIAQSDPVSFTLAGNSLSATMAGYLAAYDSSGDYFSLGNLAEGTQVSVTVRLPSTSALTPALTLYKANGTAVTPDTLSPTQLIYTLPAGAEAAYHLRIAGAAGRGVMAEYFLDLALTDTVPPTIVSNSLPAEGSTVTFFSSSFTLGFSEDMLAATVNNLANYQLVGSGGDGTFGDGNEVAYTINSPSYSSGLSASYFLPDGPLQPDTYRFTAKAALKDKLNNNLAADHVRTFTMTGVPGWVLEDRSNNTFPTADTLSLSVAANQPDGGFSDNGRTTATSGWPFDVELADLDGDGKLDAAITHLGSVDSLRIYQGNGDRTFSPASFPPGTGLQTMAGEYYDNANFTGTMISRNDAAINFNWGSGSPDPAIAADSFSIRWTGNFIAPRTGSFLLHTVTDDGVRLWVDLDRNGTFDASELFIDRWVDQGGTHYQTPSLNLTGGLAYPVKMEYYENGGGASAQLYATDAMDGIGDEPHDVELIDWDKDGDPDLAVTLAGPDAIAFFRNDSTPGSIAFTKMPNIAVGDEPLRACVGDFNGDTWPDLAVANRGTNATTGYSLSILLNDQNGSFTESKTGLSLSPKVRPWGLATGDFNKDGKADLAAGDIDNGDRVAIFLGSGDGSFGAPSFLDTPDGPNLSDLAVADFNQDGNPDLAAVAHDNNQYDYWLFPGNGDGTFGARIDIDRSYGYYDHFVKVADINGDSWPDLLMSGNDHVTVATNRADGTIGFNSMRRNWNETYGVAAGDLNGDGRPELVITDHDENRLRVLDGNASAPLAADDSATGILHGYGRGFLADSSDADVWSFSAKRGQLLTVAVDNSAFAGNPGQVYEIFDEAGNRFTYFYNNSSWQGESPPVTIPRDGTYYVRVSWWHDYRGEYRFRVSLAPPGSGQMESEDNNSIAQSDPVSFTLAGNSLSATMAGYLAAYDSSGDYFSLGNLAAGTQVSVTVRLPSTSALTPALTLYKANGTAVTPDTLSPTQLIYTLPAGAEAAYHLRIAGAAGRGVMAEYFLDLTVADTVPPAITASSLPTGTTGALVSSFNLTFNKDMLASTVNNAANYALVWAGPDGAFATADDAVIPVAPGAYSAGLSNSYNITNAPLQPGNYRFTATTGLRDKFGNNLPLPYETAFAVSQPGGFITEAEPNNSGATATPLVFNTDIPGYLTANARGVLASNFDDIEYWTFAAEAGDVMAFEVFFPYENPSYGLNWYLTDPDGTQVFNRNLSSNSLESNAPLTLTKTGTYRLRIDDWYGIRTEHRFRISLMRGLASETEQNDSLGTADPLTFAQVGGIDTASVAGFVSTSGELDYFDLGTIGSGNTVFLTVRRPAGSTLGPIVSLYSQAGTLMSETNGVAGDDSAEVQIPASGRYYALIRGSLGTTGLNGDYILDARVLPTAAVNFPNLRVTRLDDITAAGLRTGDTINLSYDVSNVGNLATSASLWVDRVVMSPNSVYGDADDIQLALITHNGTLAPGASYTVNQPLTLTDGLPGSYYLLVKTDSANAVDEILQEGDNATATANPFNVALRDYPDLLVEDLAISAPDGSGNRTVSWNLANRGTGQAAAGHATRVLVLNTTTSQLIADLTLPVSDPLAAAATVAQSHQFNTTAPGFYLVTVSADSGNTIYEYGVAGHAVAEQNSSQNNFQIYRYYDIVVTASPPTGGSVTGSGSAREGLPVTVTATPDTSVLPYVFLNWTESGAFVSAQANYTFLPTRNRNLVAVFGLPQFQIAATVSPPATGSVSGTGNFPLNTPVSLTPTPAPGYLFDHWEEEAVHLGNATPLTFTATANRSLTAFFRESVPSHVVSITTQPPGIATISGAGTYNNGQAVTITAPARIEDGDSEFLFQRFELNGQFLGSAASFNKTFSTLDAATLNYAAIYQERSLKPVVSAIACSHGTLVPIASNVTFTATFDRDMNPSVTPVFTLLSGNATAIPTIPAGGAWLDARRFRCAAVAFGTTNGGAYTLRISAAADSLNHIMAPNETFGFTMDSLTPPNPVVTLASSTPNSATIGWSGYPAPVDLSAFRYYLEDSDFTSVAGLSAKGGGNAAARSTVFSGLLPDHEYFAAVTAVDVAGNSNPAVTTLRIFLQSQVPPPVSPLLTTTGLDAVRLDWTAYDSASLVGLAGFRVYSQTTPFTDVTGLTPVAQLPATAKLHNLTGLDRSQSHYFAVVGYNGLGQLNPAVTPLTWDDPLAGSLRTNLSIGGAAAVIPIHADLTIEDGATLTVEPGTTLRFADGAGLTVLNGRIVANGTDLLPIHFTSQADDGSGAPVRGAWAGLTLSSPTGVSELSRIWLRYGNGLKLTAGSPLATRIYAVQNAGAGIAVSGSAVLDASACYLAFNDNGVTGSDSAQVGIQQSVIQNNSTANAAQADTATMNLPSNWWGTTSPAAIAAMVSGTVATPTPLAGEPVIGSALVQATGSADTGSRNVELRLMAVNAVKYRASENSAFTGVSFTDLFDPDESFRIRPYGFVLPFTLSTGAGLKTVHLQTNSATSGDGPALSVNFNYITGGPVITAFNLTEGQTLSRPYTITGSATAPLGVKWIDLLVDGVLAARNSSTSFTTLWDPRPLGNGIHRVELRARDQAGNESGRALNIITAAVPPPAPLITAPLNDTVTNTPTTTVTGTAEPGVSLRVTRNGATVSGTLNAAPNGSFSLAGVPLVEGTNTLIVSAFDSLGSAASTSVSVVFDSGPPAAPVLLEPSYVAGRGLQLEWQYAETGERPAKFKVFWHNAAFTATSQATGQSGFITGSTLHTITSLPDGSWYFSVVGYDGAGNPSALSNQRSLVVDFAKPSFTVAYDGALPAGPGDLGITLTSSEPLVATPVFSLRPAGSSGPIAVPLTRQSPTVFTSTFVVTTLSAASGTAAVTVSATDLAGNGFTGSPSGPGLVFDVTKPTGTLTLDRAAPIQTLNPVTVALGLQLSELPAVGSTPTLKFEPPVGAEVSIPLSGTGTTRTGSLNLNPAMGRGTGFFRLSVTDRAGNTGTVITPATLEIYNTELPDPPARPVGLSAQTQSAGRIAINWDDVPRAESYRIYREPGNNATVPTLLLANNLTTSEFTDTPPADGIFTYAIVATLRGADSPPSGVLNALSDRTPPPPPEDFAAILGNSGVNISWSAPSSGEVPHSYRVYRGDTVIYTTATPFSIRDNPPRGIHEYRVASVDSRGNENAVTPITVELLVSPVTNLQVLVREGSPTSMTWASNDPTVTGFNVYRNGFKQNGAPLANPFFIDSESIGLTPVTYEVTAVNAAAQESPRRTQKVNSAAFSLVLNPNSSGVEQDSLRFYFDLYRISATNLATGGDLAIERIDILRTVSGTDSLTTGSDTDLEIAPGATGVVNLVVPSPRTLGTQQTIQILARGPADPSGGRVSYESTFVKRAATEPAPMVALEPVAPPLAGGLTDFIARIYNRGPVPIEVIVGRGFGNQPGDVSVRVLDPNGVEVSRKEFKGAGVPGLTIDGSGVSFVTIAPGGSVSFTIPEVFVPEALGESGQGARFVLDVAAIRHRTAGSNLIAGGAISGQVNSSLVKTPYYGTAATAKSAYANNEVVTITGQAIDRTTGLPLPNVPLHLGFGARGFVTWQDVTTDGSGNYSTQYTPVVGFAGRLSIWAAHPDVVDQLNQVNINYSRLYLSPSRGNVVMSKNDTLDITLAILSPGDIPSTAVGMTARAYVMDGDNEVDITTVSASLLTGPFAIQPDEQKKIAVRLTAGANAPDNALLDLTFLSAEGASATFRAAISLRPAVPVLSFVSPRVGYVESSVNRGNIVSQLVTLENLGLREVENPEIIPPAGLPWMDVNLPRNEQGRILLPNIPIGGKISFTVAFAPPDATPLGFYNDFMEVRGSNLQTPFRINLFAQITSSLVGDVKFVVDNIFVEKVPNARVRLRNPNLREELGPFLTDANGEVTVTGLQEGSWSWQIIAAGHSTKTGTVDVIPAQLSLVEERLSKSLVTVEFSVVPKPFTDRYEIVIEQTFETRVPFPVLVMDPPSFNFPNLPERFESTLLVTARNEGLISMFDGTIEGQVTENIIFQPMITFVPELRAQESIVIPFRFVFDRHGINSGSGPVQSSSIIGDCFDQAVPNVFSEDFLRGVMAIMNMAAQCQDGIPASVVGGVLLAAGIWDAVNAITDPLQTLAQFIGCVVGSYLGVGSGGGGGGGGGPGGGTGGGFAGNGCFPAGTPVTLTDGSRIPIEQLKRGTTVRTSLWESGTGVVDDLIIRQSSDLRELTLREVRPGKSPLVPADLQVQITGEHLVWNDKSGWTAASALEPGDWVHHESGALLEVVTNRLLPGEHTVYTIEIKGQNAFFASGLMVQDLCGIQKLGDRSALAPQPSTETTR